MISISVLAALAGLVLITQLGVIVLQRLYPPEGVAIEVRGARINLVDIGPQETAEPPLVLLHGASSTLSVMRQPLGDRLAARRRVILLDRPGHGWSTRDSLTDSTPAAQGRMIAEALERHGVGPAILVVHSWSGALGLRMALDHPDRVAGLVLLAPVAYPWPGGVGQYNQLVARPLIGPLLAHTITLPLGLFLATPGARSVFLPQEMPEGFVRDTGTPLLLRPRQFLANAHDLVTLKQAVAEQSPRYGEIRVPVTIITGEADRTVYTSRHSRPFAAAVPQTRLIVLPELGHMVPQVVPDLVEREVDAMVDLLKAGNLREAGAAR